MSGAVSYHAGVAAEEAVGRLYEAAGYTLAARRWRSGAGEIDLIARRGDLVVFVEVKCGRDFAAAVARLGPRQLGRIAQSAEAFLANEPLGTDTPCRIDAALVDRSGACEIIENVTAA